jgi:hypothetical protein
MTNYLGMEAAPAVLEAPASPAASAAPAAPAALEAPVAPVKPDDLHRELQYYHDEKYA